MTRERIGDAARSALRIAAFLVGTGLLVWTVVIVLIVRRCA